MVVEAERLFSNIRSLLEEAVSRHHSAIDLASSATQAYNDSLEKLGEASLAGVTAANRLDFAKEKFESASQRLESAEAAQKKASVLAIDAKHATEEAAGTYKEAANECDQARRLAERTSRVSRLIMRYAIAAVALSWLGMGWTGYLMFRTRLSFWTVGTMTILIIVAATSIIRRVGNDT